MEASRKTCFIICPLGEEGSEVRATSDKLLNHVLEPVLLKNDFSPLRADQIPKVGIITTQIINLLIESPLVVADLTGANPNVFYELAVRHAAHKPYIQIAKKGEKIPFDLSAVRTIHIDLSDLDSVARAKEEIDAQIQEIERGHKPDSPISIASSARLLQEDQDLAEKIADKLSYWVRGDFYDSEQLDVIYRKLFGFHEYSFISMEDVVGKLNTIINLLSNSSQNSENND